MRLKPEDKGRQDFKKNVFNFTNSFFAFSNFKTHKNTHCTCLETHAHPQSYCWKINKLIEICNEENGFVKTEWGLQVVMEF